MLQDRKESLRLSQTKSLFSHYEELGGSRQKQRDAKKKYKYYYLGIFKLIFPKTVRNKKK